MKKNSRVASLALACVMATSIAGTAFAAGDGARAIEDNLATEGTKSVTDLNLGTGTKTESSELKLHVISGTFGDKVAGDGKLSVVIPTTIPMMMDKTGEVRTPKKIELVNNNVTNKVQIKNIKIALESGWSLEDATVNGEGNITNSLGSAGEQKLAFAIGVGADDTKNKAVPAGGTLDTSAGTDFQIPADGTLNIRLKAKGCENVAAKNYDKIATMTYELSVIPQ